MCPGNIIGRRGYLDLSCIYDDIELDKAIDHGRSTGVQYLITFGDSYSQTGFDVNSTKPSADNPLGNPPLPGWTASGGLNWVGFLVSQFNDSTLLSYNFAYGGATTDSNIVAPYESSVLSFVDQVTEFSESIASHPSYAPWTAADTLVGVWIGVNDVGNIYYLSNVTDVMDAVMARYFEQLQIIHDAGARNFVLLSVPPINETPAMLAYSDDVRDQEATVIAEYNDLLASGLANFTSTNSGVTAKLIDTSIAFQTAIDNPTAYGAPNATCYDSDGTTCLWYNDYHPGIAINKLVAEEVATAWNGSFF
ncbi:Thermolabile hemolysin [Cytospora mali]|uniref:Thermolabile hemolysin n=1 Tax=Cytospora mali TaxID=578113 RepID=A0A194VUP2_CYTMA|nr:Thermolabile hemolysin [Valsa mali]